MLIATVYFDSGGNPTIKISVYGIANEFAQEFEAIIDTGYTGFLSLPLVSAFPLGLTLCGTTSITFGDGSSQVRLTTVGRIKIEDEEHGGVIVLEPNGNQPLVGMDFLRRFKKALFISKDVINLVDEDALAALTKAREESTSIEKQEKPSTEPTASTATLPPA